MGFPIKRYGGSSGPYNSRPIKRSKVSSSDHTKLVRLQRTVNSLKPEVKCAQFTGSFANVVGGTGAIDYLSQVAQGVTKGARLGDQIRVTRLQMRIQGTAPVANSSVVNRIIIVRDKSQVGGTPSISGGVTSIFSSGNSTALQLPNNMDRFVVMKDLYYGPNEQVLGNKSGEFYIDMKLNLVTDYISTGSTAANSSKNAMYIIVLTDDTTNVQDWTWTVNLHFTDV